MRYATNDSWEEITALAGPNGFPLVHHADYGSGRLFVLTVPDNFADLYALPAPVLDHIRGVVSKGLPVRLQGPSQVSLFAYDNGTYVVHSFLDRMGVIEQVADGRDVDARRPGDGRGGCPASRAATRPCSRSSSSRTSTARSSAGRPRRRPGPRRAPSR